MEPRVYERDGFVVTLTDYGPSSISPAISLTDYAAALERLHVDMRTLDVPAPRPGSRRLGTTTRGEPRPRRRSPTPTGSCLATRYRRGAAGIGQRGGAEQLLHGEPHPGNVLTTNNGLLFIDLETCCREPVEFDLAHAPEESASTIRVLIMTCCASAGSSCWR